MSELAFLVDELRALTDMACNGNLTARDAMRLQQLLQGNVEAQRFYLKRVSFDAWLRWEIADQSQQPTRAGSFSSVTFGFLRSPLCGPIGLLSEGVQLISNGIRLTLWVAVMASLAVLMGSLAYYSWRPQQVAKSLLPARIAEPKMKLVGQITGMVGCEWASDGAPTVVHDAVMLNRQYKLESGLLEISYATGARVILEGPVTYVVESENGGYLSLGKVTGKVATQAAKGFSLRTPTAIVTDLGTEFGVKVSGAGATETQVLQGAIELRVLDANSRQPPQVLLPEHGLTCVTVGENHVVTVRRETAKPDAFVRQLAGWKQVPIELFSTGVNAAEGQPDPHWQIVAVSNDPKFRAQSAFVSRIPMDWLANDPVRSQWISLAGDAPPLPADAVYTFRTSFELPTKAMPDSARVTGQFAVDNHVRAMRLNGREMPMPEHGYESFDVFHRFAITQGFVAGTNVLEIEVSNAAPGKLVEATSMGLRVELEGSARARMTLPTDASNSRQEQPATGGSEL